MDKYTCLQCSFTSKDKRHFKKHLHKIHNRQAKCKLYFYKNIHNPKKVYNYSRSVHRGENVFFTSEDKRHFNKHLHKVNNRQAKCKLCFYKNIHNQKKVYNHSRSVHRGENVFFTSEDKIHFDKHLYKVNNRQAKCQLCFYKNIHNPKKVYNHSRSVHRRVKTHLPLKTKDISRKISIRSTNFFNMLMYLVYCYMLYIYSV